jgi:dCMP deaminase
MMTKHEYICRVAEVVAEKATCPKASVGAVFVSRDMEILATGYNGAPRGLENCHEAGCLLDSRGDCVRSAHAELNAIVQAAKRGTPLEGSRLYVTRFPCLTCAKAIVNLGATEVHAKTRDKCERSVRFLMEAGIRVCTWNGAQVWYTGETEVD